MKVVDAFNLSKEHRELLRPDEEITAAEGRTHRLPRYFYEIPSWEEAKQMQLTLHFTLAELITVDCREADLLLRQFPHYVPCAVAILARYLESFRQRVEAPVFVSVNGGYRSPAHGLATGGRSPHYWAAAADIYRVGDSYLDNQSTIEKYAKVAQGIGEEVHVKPFGHGPGETDDHLHFDLGFVTLVPRL
jgi:hypothetical protein